MVRTRIKICGITSLAEARAAIAAGADALGFVFAPGRHRVTPEEVARISRQVPIMVSRVGVFVNTPCEEIARHVEECGLDALQFHGEEGPGLVETFLPRATIKAIPVKDRSSLQALNHYPHSTPLLDTYHPGLKGGTGETFEWALLKEMPPGVSFLLAGGLHPGNIREALKRAHPYGVDVSSGVETEGKKDPGKISAFIKEVRRWDAYAAR